MRIRTVLWSIGKENTDANKTINILALPRDVADFPALVTLSGVNVVPRLTKQTRGSCISTQADSGFRNDPPTSRHTCNRERDGPLRHTCGTSEYHPCLVD